MSNHSENNLGSLLFDGFDQNGDGDSIAAIGDNLAGNRNSLAKMGNTLAVNGNIVADHSNSISTIINASADDQEIAQSLDRLNALYQQTLSLHPQFQDPDHDIEGCPTCRTMLSTYLFLSRHGHL